VGGGSGTPARWDGGGGRTRPAALAGVVALGAALVGYYVPHLILPWLFSDIDAVRIWSGYAVYWTAAAVVLGPVLGVLGAAMRRADPLGWLACSVLPLGTAYDVVVRDGFRWTRFRFEPVFATAEVSMLLGALLLAVLAVSAARRRVPA
jgi:hypothetical protein